MPDSSSSPMISATESRPHPYERWVDFLPSSEQCSQREDGSALKRVSLDATETWLGDEDDDELLDQQPLDDTMMILESWPDQATEAIPLPSLMAMDDLYLSHDGSSILMSEMLLGDTTLSPTRVGWTSLPATAADRSDTKAQTKQRPSLLRTSSSSSSESQTNQLSLEELFEKRRAQLAASMERSQKSRKCLEQHIQQRANLASVLADIERSSRQVEKILTSDGSVDERNDLD